MTRHVVNLCCMYASWCRTAKCHTLKSAVSCKQTFRESIFLSPSLPKISHPIEGPSTRTDVAFYFMPGAEQWYRYQRELIKRYFTVPRALRYISHEERKLGTYFLSTYVLRAAKRSNGFQAVKKFVPTFQFPFVCTYVDLAGPGSTGDTVRDDKWTCVGSSQQGDRMSLLKCRLKCSQTYFSKINAQPYVCNCGKGSPKMWATLLI
jgi:hypothetical protein